MMAHIAMLKAMTWQGAGVLRPEGDTLRKAEAKAGRMKTPPTEAALVDLVDDLTLCIQHTGDSGLSPCLEQAARFRPRRERVDRRNRGSEKHRFRAVGRGRVNLNPELHQPPRPCKVHERGCRQSGSVSRWRPRPATSSLLDSGDNYFDVFTRGTVIGAQVEAGFLRFDPGQYQRPSAFGARRPDCIDKLESQRVCHGDNHSAL
jgi:hypothetical protein